ncbi:MAG: glycosyltransferase family 4 protein [Actinobacteria bacterium]|nr:glycosyltransferase family 4 protein [Actinomycetota bacterium]
MGNDRDSEVGAEGRKLRVVFVGHIARVSGGEVALSRLVPALMEHIELSVVLGEDGPIVERLRQFGVPVEVLPLAPRLRDIRKDSVRASGFDLRALAALPAYILRLRGRIRELDADIVHTNTLKAALYGGAAARLAGVPAVWHIRDRIADDYLPHGAVRLVRLAARILPSAVIANSQSTLDALPNLKRSRVLYNPIVVPDSVDQPADRPAVAGTELVIGIVGRLAPWKGQHVFLESFAEAFGGTAVRGRIIGSALFGEDDYAQALRDQAQRLAIAEQVEFRGFREDVWAELAELDVLVHCSITPEPFGQVVLEAMAGRVPVVAARAGGPAELITDGVDGLLTAPGDVGELAAALRGLAGDPKLRSALARAGKERSLEFTPERTAAQLLGVYRRIARRR